MNFILDFMGSMIALFCYWWMFLPRWLRFVLKYPLSLVWGPIWIVLLISVWLIIAPIAFIWELWEKYK